MRIENLLPLKLHKLTQQQYDREKNAGNIEGTGLYLTPDTSVSFEPQELSAEQQAQARANINAGPAGHVDEYIATTSEAHMLTRVLAYCENSATEPGRVYRILVEFTPTGSTFEFKPGTWLFEITKSSTSDVRHIKATTGSNAIMFTYDGSSTSAFEHGITREDLTPVDFSYNVLLNHDEVADHYTGEARITVTPLEYMHIPSQGMVFFNISFVFAGRFKKGDSLRFPYGPKVDGGVLFRPHKKYTYAVSSRTTLFSAEHYQDAFTIHVNEDIDTDGWNDSCDFSGWFFCD